MNGAPSDKVLRRRQERSRQRRTMPGMRCRILAGVLSLAFGLTASGALPANAEGSVPPPRLSIAEYLHGTQLPAASATGNWQVRRPGEAASLQVSGVNPVGCQTVVRAVWTSHAWRPRKGVAINATWSVTEDGVAMGGTGGLWNIQRRLRYGHGHWSPWAGPSDPFGSIVPHVVTYAAAPGRTWVEFLARPRKQVQFQFRLRYVAAAIGLHSASFAVSTAE